MTTDTDKAFTAFTSSRKLQRRARTMAQAGGYLDSFDAEDLWLDMDGDATLYPDINVSDFRDLIADYLNL